jgi:hypothetical protein
MRTLKITSNDLVLSGSDLIMLTNTDALAQVIENRLKLWLGEWFGALTSGIDYLTLFSEKQLLQEKARRIFRNAILADSRITNIKELEITYVNSTRSMTVRFVAESTVGLIAGSV